MKLAKRIVETLLDGSNNEQIKKELADAFQRVGKPLEVEDFALLSNKCLAVLHARFVEGRSRGELAAEYNVSQEAIRNLENRAVRRLCQRILALDDIDNLNMS